MSAFHELRSGFLVKLADVDVVFLVQLLDSGFKCLEFWFGCEF